MGEAFIVRRGGVGEEVLRTAVPSINFISASATSLTFTFKNNEDAEVDLFFGLTTPPTTKITLAANATSSNQTITGLEDTQNFDVFAYAIVTDPTSKKIKSEIVETQAQTLIPTPTITQVSKTETSITFTVRNNSRVAADVVYDLVTPPVETTLQLAANTTSANQTISGLTASTSFTVFAQAKVAGFADSTIASSTVTTNAPPLVFTAATGGTTQEYNSGGKRFRSHTFTSNGNFVVSTVGDATGDRNKVDYLIIAGGGSGGAVLAGGGGAGGYRTTVTPTPGDTTVNPKITVTAQTFGIVVGAGGAATSSNTEVFNGGNSSGLGVTSTGGGGGVSEAPGGTVAGNGGSGGGASFTATTGGTGISGQGFAGGNNSGQVSAQRAAGAGGGGASNVGANSPNADNAGNGANGLFNNLRTGSNETRAGGGGGGIGISSSGSFGTGGSGGGGTGTQTGNATAGTVNTGSGGGGGGQGTGVNGGAGGSGLVVIRYEIAPA